MLCEFCGGNNPFGQQRCSRCNGLLRVGPPASAWVPWFGAAAAGTITVASVLILVFWVTVIVPGWNDVIFSVKYISIPLAIAVLFFLRRLWTGNETWRELGWWLLGYAILFMMAVAIVKGVNIAGPGNGTYLIEGEVLQREGRFQWTAPRVYVRQSGSGSTLELEVPDSEYEEVKLNSHFGVCFYVGWLGIPYRWRHRHEGVCSFIRPPAAPSPVAFK